MWRARPGLAAGLPVAIACLLLAACSGTGLDASPGATPAATLATQPSLAGGPFDASSAPTATTALPATSGIGADWERLAGFPANGRIMDGVGGPGGWALVGCMPGDTCSSNLAAAWFSADGGVSTPATIGHPGQASSMSRVAWNGSYIAAGRHYRSGDREPSIAVWGSADAQSWNLLGRFERANCDDYIDTCTEVRSVGRTPSGALVVTMESLEPSRGAGLYQSGDNGASWMHLPGETFRATEPFLSATDLVQFDGRLLLAGAPCQFCPAGIWTTLDGLTWDEAGELGAAAATRSSLAASDALAVAAVRQCRDDACDTEIWTSLDGSAWTLATDGIDITETPDSYEPMLAFTGKSFVLVEAGGSGELRVHRSADGLSWTEVEPNLRPDAGCTVSWLAGNEGQLLLGDPDCGAWRSTED